MFMSLMILTISIVLASEAPPSENTYLLATALFYTDTQGRILLVSGPLPFEVDHTIKDDLHNRIPEPNVEVKVVPAFRDFTDIPIHKNVLNHLKSLHPNVYIIDLTQFQSRKIMQTMVEHIHRRKNKKDNEINQQLNKTDSAVNVTTTENYISTVKLESSPEDFIPNDIYYGVEMRCANWADGCDLKSGSLLSMPSKYVKIPRIEYYRPQKIHWWP